MARSEHDSWDAATGVGATATLAATARAVATRDGLIDDPFAEPLVRAVGVEFFTRVASGELALADLRDNRGFARLIRLFAVRTRFFDNFLAGAGRAGIRQAVILAAGLDARPYRLWWAAGTTVYEIDQPEVIDLKTQTMRALGVTPAVNRRAVGIDLRQDWPTALRQVGFDATQPTAWIAEGLLIGFLPPDIQDQLLDGVTALSAVDSRLAPEYLPKGRPPPAGQERALAERWRAHGLDVDLTDLTYPGEHSDAAEYLAAHGWETVELPLAELFAATGLRQDDPADAPLLSSYVDAIRT